MILFSNANDVELTYNNLNYLSTTDKVASVRNFSFHRDVAEFNFNTGQVYLLSPVNGKTVAMIFKGLGSVSITPPTKISKERFISKFKEESLNREFNTMFMIFTDSTLTEFSNKLNFSDNSVENMHQTDISECLRYIYDHITKDFDKSLLTTLLNDEQDGYFYSQFYNNIDEPIFYEYNPNREEEVSVSIRAKKRTRKDRYRSIVSKFHSKEDYISKKDLSFDDKDIVEVNGYKIEAEVTKKMDFSAKCDIDIKFLQESGKWLCCKMEENLRIKSITDGEGTSLYYFKEDESPDLWIELPEKPKLDTTYSISIKYDGDFVIHAGRSIAVRSYIYWFPQLLTSEQKHFDITFKYPSNYDFVTVGRKYSEEKVRRVKTSNWKTVYPTNYAPFIMGKFKKDEFQNSNLPHLEFVMNDDLKNTIADVANSVSFYDNIYGKCIYDSINVTKIPYFIYGKSYPGLVNVYFNGFIKDAVNNAYFDIYDLDDDKTLFRAHMAAQQWWGCGVKARSYHDLWLFEGLAEFSSIWFIQTSLNDTKKYFNYLSRWRDKLTKELALTRLEDETEPPLWLGYRAPYYTTYFKGGWVFHMLRNLMIDLNTYDETRFKTMMKDFYNSYKGKKASTEDFKNIVEKHMKSDMTWFFDQWVYGNEIPKFEFAYDVVKADDGIYYANCVIEQKNVSDTFKSYIPIEVEFTNNQKARVRRIAVGTRTEFKLKLPNKPKEIRFNILSSVLSEG
jgi:hypothetical protein